MTNVTHKFLSMYLFLALYMFQAHCAHHQERHCVNTTSGNCQSVSVALSRAHDTATDTDWELPEVVLTRSVPPDDKHIVLIIRRDIVSIQPLVTVNLCQWLCRVHTTRPLTQIESYQRLYWHDLSLLMTSTLCSSSGETLCQYNLW